MELKIKDSEIPLFVDKIARTGGLKENVRFVANLRGLRISREGIVTLECDPFELTRWIDSQLDRGQREINGEVVPNIDVTRVRDFGLYDFESVLVELKLIDNVWTIVVTETKRTRLVRRSS